MTDTPTPGPERPAAEPVPGEAGRVSRLTELVERPERDRRRRDRVAGDPAAAVARRHPIE